ncbi:hypothetical protein SAMN00777080_0371 [Aquiflexum balticum DSM 16537]|uniref:Uncharacterized protein n=1 Tax=Aquiflexum balticum DSM 16537 TaxID=758820 RepID=A0A1W2GYQ6_9BACT|nr:hypothetical protein [Aquiflexum balticum]SMD41840.1 hypothetical protein SAMN00777080_0371 [Aquiflexum balticum DSM 16537]
MKNQLDKLFDKYWEGETSPEEEKILRDLLLQSEGYEAEKDFFLGLEEIAAIKENDLTLEKPIRKFSFSRWLSIAALFLVFLVAGVTIRQNLQKQAEEEAYEKVMNAFALINENMQKGTGSLELMQDFRHLNAPQEIFEIKETK